MIMNYTKSNFIFLSVASTKNESKKSDFNKKYITNYTTNPTRAN